VRLPRPNDSGTARRQPSSPGTPPFPNRPSISTTAGLPEAATILARQGQADSAIVLFERALATSSLYGGSFYEVSWYSQTLAMLGDLYEARGNRAKAIEYYQRYVELLEHADPPLAAQVAVVREKLVRLTGESGAIAKP